MKTTLSLSLLIVMVSVMASANAAQPNSLFGGLISFRNGPDPAGKTPVYWATSQTLYVVQDAHVAEVKFGSTWIAQIRWCGDANGHPLPGECTDIYYNFQHGNPVTLNTQDLLHP